MKKVILIFTMIFVAGVALAGCSKKPRSIFDYKDCVFSGTSGLLKTVEPEDYGYSLVLLSAGSPVKLLDWNKERERFHVRAQKGLASGWCGVHELEFKPNVLDFLDDFILQDKELFKNFDRFIVANKNAYLLDSGRLSHLFTINAWPDYSSLRVRFYSAPKSVLCLYGDDQFKNQYEAWRFSDSGEILSHRVFRDDREYEEYLKTIYKTEDSK